MHPGEVILARQRVLAGELQSAVQGLQTDDDDQALHDLRVALRRLQSLLMLLPDVDNGALAWAVRAAIRLLGPARDLETVCAELERLGLEPVAVSRLRRLRRMRRDIVRSQTMTWLQQALAAWPAQAEIARRRDADWPHPHRMARQQQRQLKTLRQALATQPADRHGIRLLIKALRYSHRVYPEPGLLSPRLRASLIEAQSAVGRWHDTMHWLVLAECEVDLQAGVPGWQAALRRLERDADHALEQLRQRLSR